MPIVSFRPRVMHSLALISIFTGCGPENSMMAGEEGGSTGGEEPGPSYAACSLNGDWNCTGADCALDDDAVHWIELIQEEIDARGWTDSLFVVEARTYPGTDQVLVSVVQEVGWFRAWGPINGLKTDEGDEAFRQRVNDVFDAWGDPPASIVPHQMVLDAFADCHPALDYDPCTSHFFGYGVWDAVEVHPEPNCVEHLHTVSIALDTGNVVCETDLPPVGCD